MQLIRAARYLGVPPWELIEQPAYWMHAAIATEEAHTRAGNMLRKRAEQQRKG